MAAGGGSSGSGSSSSSSSAPKILLAKPSLVTTSSAAAKFNRGGGGDDDSAALTRSLGSLNLISDSSWDFHADRFLPFLTDNTDFTVVGIIGPPGVGKSTILNEIYGCDGGSPGMLPPFAIESEETKASARHCTVGIEPRISNERIILLDTQPVFSPSVLAEMIRPDGLSTISILGGDTLSAELAHELMGIQSTLIEVLPSVLQGTLLARCFPGINLSHSTSGVRRTSQHKHVEFDVNDLLKHGIPDPSSLTLSHPQSSSLGSSDKENKDKLQEGGDEYVATPVFVHAKLHDQDLAPRNLTLLKEGLSQYFSSSFVRSKSRFAGKRHNSSSGSSTSLTEDSDSAQLKLFFLPYRPKDGSPRGHCESYSTMLWKIRDQILSMDRPSFSRTVSERDWLKNSAKIWELVKNSSIIAEYSKTLQNSGMFRR